MNKRIGITEKAFYALSPAIAYIFTFLYELGFAEVYKIPSEFIEISITQIIITTGAVALAITPVFWIVSMVSANFNGLGAKIYNIGVRILPILIVTLTLIVLYGDFWHEWWLFGAILLVVLFTELVLPLITKRKIKGYKNKLIEAQGNFEKIPTAWDYFDRKASIAILILVFLACTSYNAGRARAFNQTDFIVFNTRPERLVLRTYGDNLVMVNFDRDCKTVKLPLFIVDKGSINVGFINEHLGHLIMKN